MNGRPENRDRPAAPLRLGLIGDNIAASRAPELHRLCGQLCNRDVSYELLIPPALGLDFDQVFDRCRDDGFDGVNVTLPYKEKARARVHVSDPLVARIGSVNTVVFAPGGPLGFNTDHSGFIAAWRDAFGPRAPGRAVILGAGGVGKAVAFALISLGALQIDVVDTDHTKAAQLAQAVTEASAGTTRGEAAARLADLAGKVTGIANCTPLGMTGYGGSPVPEGTFPRVEWAFDAVYTPLETPFRAQALAAGARFLSGYELFFHQGLDAFAIFAGTRPERPDALRVLLDRQAQAADRSRANSR